MPPDAVARSVAHLPQRKIWQRYAFAFNPVKLSLFALAYLVAYGYGTLFLQTAAAPLWFPDSVLLCALLLTPANEWWLYLAIAVPIRLIPTPHPAIPLWFVFATSANDLIKATFAAYLLRRLPNGSSHPSTMPQLGTFLGVGVFVVPILSAFAGAATRHLLGYGFWVSWYQWFLGDALTNVVLTPALLYWSSKRFRALRPRTAELGLWIAGFALSLMLALTLAHSAYSPIAVCVPVPFLIWAATRFGLIGASTSLSVIALLGTARIAEKTALFSMGFESKSLIFLQLFLFVVSIPVLCIATVIEEKDSVEKTLRESQHRERGILDAVRESEQRFRLVAESAPVLIWMAGTDKLRTYFNKPWLDFTGRPLEQEVGNGWADGVHPDDFQRCLDIYTQSFDRREKFEMEYRLRRYDGEYRWILDIGVPRFNQDRSSEGYIGIAVDVTDHKMAEQALREMNRVLEERTAALQTREELLKSFVTHVPAAVAMLDRDMRYLQVSDRWCADYSLGSSEILGRSHYEVFPDIPERWKEIHRRGLAGETLRAMEDRWDRESGTTWLRWEIRPWQNQNGVPGGILIFSEDVTHRKNAEEALLGMSQKLIEAHEQERTRIGRDLHDDVVQRLVMLALELEGVQQDVPDSASEVRTRIGTLQNETTRITNDVQLLSHELHSSKLEYLGIVGAAKNFCKEFSERQKVEIDFQSHDLPPALPTELSLSLFRVLQEALRNATKHSGVKHYEVRLWGSTGEVHLTVSDLGGGFDIEGAMKSTGLGLTSMQERLRLVGGELTINSQPKGGTTIHARVPFNSSSDSARAAGQE
jgi:PAS domain S-box-containing protein